MTDAAGVPDDPDIEIEAHLRRWRDEVVFRNLAARQVDPEAEVVLRRDLCRDDSRCAV